MWARTLQASRRQLLRPQRAVRHVRKYNGQAQSGPHTTYFQPPPPQQPSRSWRIIRTLLWSTTCFGLGMFASAWAFTMDELDELLGPAEDEAVKEAMLAGAYNHMARNSPGLSVEAATRILDFQSAYSISPTAVAHTGQHGSNLPCEDTWSSGSFAFLGDPKKDWQEWSIFDGHAGACTSEILRKILPLSVGASLAQANCFNRSYIPNDVPIISAIKDAFTKLDHDLVQDAWRLMREDMTILDTNAQGALEFGGHRPLPLAMSVASGAAAFSGSCALLALFDPVRSILRVANVGDSRAVLGRWDSTINKYVAIPMSVDQTGFNQDEVARLAREHPGEDVVDPKTGRVHGLAVSRAFGDARWKWTEEITRFAHEKFFGPAPRPNGVIKTPPYLTAEPEIMETKVQTGVHSDFLIMASDGLWDNMTSEVAIECVEAWMNKNKPLDFLQKDEEKMRTWLDLFTDDDPARIPTISSSDGIDGDEDTYYDESERCRKWKVEPKHFVVEDTNCGTHLIKNALGGRRRELFTGVMSVQPPWSRNVRDDITVHVIFFGVNAQKDFDRLMK